jgi:hypothetical protein
MTRKPVDPDVAKVLRAARALERRIETYVADGSNIDSAQKTEIAIFKSRDKLEDMLRPLGLTDNAQCLEAIERVKVAARAMTEAARATRIAGYERESKRLREQERDLNARISGYDKELRVMRNGRLR